jgi:hypothetical protein
MPFVGTVSYRLAGNLFSNKYYFPDPDVADAITAFEAIITAQAAFQTTDVEYVEAHVTDLSLPYTTHPVVGIPTQGGESGLPTAPAITFLEFVFYSTANKSKTTHRIRGYSTNSKTDLGVFNANSGGMGDPDSGSSAGDPIIQYVNYLSTVATSSVDRNLNVINYSERVSIGAKRATARL